MNNIGDPWVSDFLENSIYRLDEGTRMIKISLEGEKPVCRLIL